MALALAAVAPLITGCSENVEQGLYPDSGSHISLSAVPTSTEVASGFHNGLLALGSAQSATSFSVTTTTRWTVEVTNCEGAWCQISYGDNRTDVAGQIGDGTFIIDAAPNRTTDDRTCDVIVRAVDIDGNPIPGVSQEIHIEQDRQSIIVNYAGDEISAQGTTTATEPTVTVTANQAWTVSSSYSWVSIIPGNGMNGSSFTPSAGSTADQTVEFRISVQPNLSTADRTAELTVSSPTSAFTPIRINVTQKGSTSTFIVTPTVVPIVADGGEQLTFQVYSSRDSWTVHAVGDWVTIDGPAQGTASAEPVTVRATVAANTGRDSRDASLVFVRGEGKGEVTVNFTQAGNPSAPDPNYTPVVSAPWLVDGWTAAFTQIRAYYFSPSIDLTGCGAYVTPVGGNTLTVPGSFADNGQIIVDVEGLEISKEYEASVYVSYILNGETRYSTGSSIRFTTPGQSGGPGDVPAVPNPGDNTPPSVD